MKNRAFHFDEIEQTVSVRLSEIQHAIQSPWVPMIAIAIFGLSVLTYSIGTTIFTKNDNSGNLSVPSQLKTEELNRLSQLFEFTPPPTKKFYKEMNQTIHFSKVAR